MVASVPLEAEVLVKEGDRCSGILPAVSRHEVVPCCLPSVRFLLHDHDLCVAQDIGVENVEEDAVVPSADSGERSDDAIDEEIVEVDGGTE